MDNFKRFESFSLHGRKTPTTPTAMNEDHLVMAHNLFAVIDGATQRQGKNIGAQSTGAFLAEFLHRNLTHIAQDAAYKDVEASILLAGLNRAFGEKIAKEAPEMIEKGFSFGPAAAISLIRLHDDASYSFANAGDCTLVEFGTHGEIFQCPNMEKPAHLEQDRLEQLATLKKERGIDFDEAWELEEVQAKYDAYKEAINVEWPVITGDPRLENVMLRGRRPLENVASLVLMSDGMFLPGANEVQGAEMAARQMLEHGITPYTMSLQKLYDADQEREKFPRFKHQDDASALLIQFQEMLKN
jgi:hypothetical protein